MANVQFSTGEICMANRYSQKLGDLCIEKVLGFHKQTGALPGGFDVRASKGVPPLTAALEGSLHAAFGQSLADAQKILDAQGAAKAQADAQAKAAAAALVGVEAGAGI